MGATEELEDGVFRAFKKESKRSRQGAQVQPNFQCLFIFDAFSGSSFYSLPFKV